MTSTNVTTANRKDLNAKTARFEHRHFATIAAMIRDMRRCGSPADADCVAAHFARELCATNGRFNPDRFLAACGVDDDWRNVDPIEPEYGLAAARKAARR